MNVGRLPNPRDLYFPQDFIHTYIHTFLVYIGFIKKVCLVVDIVLIRQKGRNNIL